MNDRVARLQAMLEEPLLVLDRQNLVLVGEDGAETLTSFPKELTAVA